MALVACPANGRKSLHFQVLTMVTLDTVVAIDQFACGTPVVGYVTTFGVNAKDFSEAVLLVQRHMLSSKSDKSHQDSGPDGQVAKIEIDLVDKSDWPEEVIAKAKNIHVAGIYYESSRAYYSDESN
jgi:hypothetical protein